MASYFLGGNRGIYLRCNHCQQLTPEFRRAAELIETKDVETSPGGDGKGTKTEFGMVML